MRKMIQAGLALMLLSACGSGKDKIADRVEENADRRADAMEAASDSMTNALQQNVTEQQANLVRDAGKERADAIRESDLRADQLSSQQKNALVKGEQ